MIKQIHVQQCDSTQDLLKEQLSSLASHEQVLVSCEEQLNGRGRGENKWTAMPGTVCFSFNIQPHKVLSFTALEISLLIVNFFSSKHRSLKLKWPNDLWDENGKKCGGILVQGQEKQMLAGIGINLFSAQDDLGAIYPATFVLDKKALSLELAQFIYTNRYDSTALLIKDWESHCGHMNQLVTITENGEVLRGEFIGLGEHGEALLSSSTGIQKIFNGSLRLT